MHFSHPLCVKFLFKLNRARKISPTDPLDMTPLRFNYPPHANIPGGINTDARG